MPGRKELSREKRGRRQADDDDEFGKDEKRVRYPREDIWGGGKRRYRWFDNIGVHVVVLGYPVQESVVQAVAEPRSKRGAAAR